MPVAHRPLSVCSRINPVSLPDMSERIAHQLLVCLQVGQTAYGLPVMTYTSGLSICMTLHLRYRQKNDALLAS